MRQSENELERVRRQTKRVNEGQTSVRETTSEREEARVSERERSLEIDRHCLYEGRTRE